MKFLVRAARFRGCGTGSCSIVQHVGNDSTCSNENQFDDRSLGMLLSEIVATACAFVGCRVAKGVECVSGHGKHQTG
jgi:hypothetical protein